MKSFLGSSSSSFVFQPFELSSPNFPRPNPKTLTLIFRAESKPTSKRNSMQGSGNSSTGGSRKLGKKSSYGSSRRSVIEKTFSQEQLVFTTPISEDPVVAIIGGGMSGMLCALGLEKRGIRSTVFDTGVHGLGGRMGTRIIDPQPLIFDHAAQFFTVSDSQFQMLVDGWGEKGLIREWTGLIGVLEVGGHFMPIPSLSPRYIGVEGMRPLADSILSEIVGFPCSRGVERLVREPPDLDFLPGSIVSTVWISGLDCSKLLELDGVMMVSNGRYPDEEAGQVPMAFVVRRPQINLDHEQVMDFVAKQVAPYKKIRRVSFIDSIPRTPSGKILRKDLVKLATSISVPSKL